MSENEPGQAGTNWLLRLRGWFARTAATPRGRAVLGGSALAAGVAVVLAIMFVAGPRGGAPGASPGPSDQGVAGVSPSPRPPIEFPWDVTFEMSATMVDASGVHPDTEFVLTSADDLPVDTVLALLRVEPEVPLNVARESAGQYRIRAEDALEPGEIYRFVLQDVGAPTPHVLASFAFQTRTPVGVVQTIPRDQSTGVPINTGIELTFTQEGVEDIEGHFRIEPAVPGTFEIHRRTIVFVPQGGLAPATLYTVTVTGGLTVAGSDEVMADDLVFRFETADERRTGEIGRPYLNFTRRTAESSTSEAPALETYLTAEVEVTLSVQVFRFDGAEGFLDSLEEYEQLPEWAGATREGFVTDTVGLEQVAAFDAAVQRIGASGKAYIQFPAPLPAGFYVVQSEFDGQPFQAWLQVTDLATYAAVAEDRTLVWVNDVLTQGPLADATVEFIGAESSGQTGSDGTLTLDTPAESVQTRPIDGFSGGTNSEVRGSLLVTAPDGRVAVVPLGYTDGYFFFGYSLPAQFNGDAYWRHLSTDRPLYLPTDTLRFWGIARQRENPGPRTVTVQLRSYSYIGYDYQPVVVVETDVETNALGTFTGELAFAGLSPEGYDLTMSVDGEVIGQTFVQVQTYTKPAYQLRVVPDRLAAFAGEPITFSIEATFLEGSPVRGLDLTYGGSSTGQVTTDENGVASVTLTAGEGDGAEFGVRQAYLSVAPVLAEEGDIIGEAPVSVYPASVTSLAETDVEGAEGVITGTVRFVDLSGINEGTATTGRQEDVLGAPAEGVTVSFDVTDVSYLESEVGEYYDFIAKIVRKQYEYTVVRAPLGTFTAVTDGDGAFRSSFPLDPARTYEIDMRTVDAEGRTEAQQLYLSGPQSAFFTPHDYVYLSGFDLQPTLGTVVSVAMHRGAGELPSGGANRYLFVEAQRGVHDYVVQGDSTYELEFGEDDVPSVSVIGVWFNGRTYLEATSFQPIRFDPAERGLEIQISPDRERYEPGAEATLEITVTDVNGEVQPDTEVNLAVADEALFLVQGGGLFSQEVLPAVYASVGSGILRTYVSHQYPTDVPQTGGGATTGGGRRTDFADNAFYGTVTTDAAGHASVSFTLPDNLTSWRVTAQAFTDRILAGTGLGRVPVGLPFFVDATLSDEYLVTDEPEIRLRSFGTVLEASDEVTFSVSAPSLGLDEPVEVSAAGFEAVRVPLPELREGEHEIVIQALSGNYEDGLVRTVRVVQSRLLAAATRFYELESGLLVEGSESGPTRVVFSDHERGRHYATLQQLTWGYGDRLDQRLARDVAIELLAAFYHEEGGGGGEAFDASAYQAPEGGIALFPYAGQDLTLSARVAAIAPDRFGSAGLVRTFLGVLGDPGETRERQVIALYGLAAMGEPVLVPLQSLLTEADLTWRERLYAGLALMEVGDDAGARSVHEALIDEFGESVEPAYRLRIGTDQDDTLEATSLAAILGAGLGDPRAPQLFDYTTANTTRDTLVELEQIAFLVEALPRLSSAPVRLAYTVDGERTEVSLESGDSHAVMLTAEQLASLRLEPIEGSAGVASFYTAPLDLTAVEVDPDVTVLRSYGTDPAAFQEGQLVQVFLTAQFGPQALDGCYQLTDLLPSGLRPVTRMNAWYHQATVNYPYRIDGQRVSFCVSKDPSNQGASYWARVVGTGEYTAEPAVIQSMQSARSINFSAPNPVTIE